MSTAVTALTLLDDLAETGSKAPALFPLEVRAAERFWDFFTANIRNSRTRRAYYNAACRFAEFCAERGVHELEHVKAVHVAAYVESLRGGRPYHLGPSASMAEVAEATMSVPKVGIHPISAALMIRIIGVGNCELLEYPKLGFDQVPPDGFCGRPCRMDVQLFQQRQELRVIMDVVQVIEHDV